MKTRALRAGQFVEFVLLVKGMKQNKDNENWENTDLNEDMTVAVVDPGSFLGLIDNCWICDYNCDDHTLI